MLNSNLINFNTKLQKTITCNSTGAKYIVLKVAIQESIYLLKILQYLRDIDLVKLTKEFSNTLVDNLGAISPGSNSTHYNKTKYIDISYHFIKETIESENIKVLHILNKLQVADLLIKGLFIRPVTELLRYSALQELEILLSFLLAKK
jgi:hypothetical protein